MLSVARVSGSTVCTNLRVLAEAELKRCKLFTINECEMFRFCIILVVAKKVETQVKGTISSSIFPRPFPILMYKHEPFSRSTQPVAVSQSSYPSITVTIHIIADLLTQINVALPVLVAVCNLINIRADSAQSIRHRLDIQTIRCVGPCHH